MQEVLSIFYHPVYARVQLLIGAYYSQPCLYSLYQEVSHLGFMGKSMVSAVTASGEKKKYGKQ